VKPRGKGRIAAKTSDLAIELNKDVLSKILSFESVLQHTQTDRIDPSMVTLVDLFKRNHVAASGCLSQLKIAGRSDVGQDFSRLYAFGIVGSFALLQDRII
jgi:hypothetical protein